jgi:hypothetical protein
VVQKPWYVARNPAVLYQFRSILGALSGDFLAFDNDGFDLVPRKVGLALSLVEHCEDILS